MNTETCQYCKKQTVSVICTGNSFVCYSCYIANKEKNGTKKRAKKHEESDIQSDFFRQIKLIFPTLPDKLLFHIPNGGSRNKLEAVNLKRQGTKSGVADVILLIPKGGFSSLCLEFKTLTGKQSNEQKEFQKQAEKAGNKYAIVRSVKEAIEEVKSYMEQ